MKVINSRFLNRVLMSAKFLTFIWLDASFMFFKLNLLFKINRKNEEKVIRPKPPVWIRIKIIVFPKLDHCVKVSFVVNPVTHVDDVAVNKQSKKEAFSPLFEDIGSINRKVPTKIIVIKLKQTVRTGFFLIKFFFLNVVNTLNSPIRNQKIYP